MSGGINPYVSPSTQGDGPVRSRRKPSLAEVFLVAAELALLSLLLVAGPQPASYTAVQRTFAAINSTGLSIVAYILAVASIATMAWAGIVRLARTRKPRGSR